MSKKMTTVPVLVLHEKDLSELGARVAALYRGNPERRDPKSVVNHAFSSANPREFSFPSAGTWPIVVVVTTNRDPEWQEAMCRACAKSGNGEVDVCFFILNNIEEARGVTDEYLATHLPMFVA